MPIDFRWQDDARTILRVTPTPPWDWNLFHRTLRRAALRLDEVTGPVDLLLDFTTSKPLPAGVVGHLRSVALEHPNSSHRTVIIGIDDTTQRAIGASNGVYKRGDRVQYFAASEAEALALIASWRG